MLLSEEQRNKAKQAWLEQELETETLSQEMIYIRNNLKRELANFRTDLYPNHLLIPCGLLISSNEDIKKLMIHYKNTQLRRWQKVLS